MTVELTDEEANQIAMYLDRYTTRDDAPWGPDEREANDLAKALRERQRVEERVGR